MGLAVQRFVQGKAWPALMAPTVPTNWRPVASWAPGFCVSSLQAVCCEDREHCCPDGYTCDIQHSACVKSGASSQLISLAPIRARQVKGVKCDDQTSCKDGQTCCQLASGEWGCCPFPQVSRCRGATRVAILIGGGQGERAAGVLERFWAYRSYVFWPTKPQGLWEL